MSNMHEEITGLILVGGKSRRMGQDKAFLKIAGRPLFERVLTLFRTNFSQLLLAGDRPERFTPYNLKLLPDIYPGSPLGGIYTGLYHATTDYIFVSSCDLPFPNSAILNYLCSLRQGFDVVVPVLPHGYEPLFALYSKACLEPVKSYLESGNCCAFGYYPQLRVREVATDELATLERSGNSFLNLNTPEDYALLGKE